MGVYFYNMISINEYEKLRNAETDTRKKANLFNQMDIKEQMKYYIDKIEEGWTLKKMETSLTHKQVSGIKTKFEKHGLSWDRDIKRFIKITEEKAPKMDDDTIKRIEELEKQVSEIQKMFDTSLTITKEIILTNDEYKGDLKTRSFRTYEDVLNNFVTFCVSNGRYSQQDLIAQALIDFMKKYKVK